MLHTEYAGVALAGGGALHFDPRRADILRRTYTLSKYCTGVVCLNIDMNEVLNIDMKEVDGTIRYITHVYASKFISSCAAAFSLW